MPSRQFFLYLGVGLLVVAAAVLVILHMTRGAHLELQGAILKVRTIAMDEKSSVAVIDFRFVNPSDLRFVVRTVEVWLEDSSGERIAGKVVSEVDARRLFQYYPLLGQKFNDTLLPRHQIGSRQSQDRMVAARFEMPEARLQSRKLLRVRIEDVDGAVSALEEPPR